MNTWVQLVNLLYKCLPAMFHETSTTLTGGTAQHTSAESA